MMYIPLLWDRPKRAERRAKPLATLVNGISIVFGQRLRQLGQETADLSNPVVN